MPTKPRKSKKQKKLAEPCHVFALCENDAVTTIPNPILGEVPACQRCADWYAKMSTEDAR